jgi:hypothetical protein
MFNVQHLVEHGKSFFSSVKAVSVMFLGYCNDFNIEDSSAEDYGPNGDGGTKLGKEEKFYIKSKS